MFAPQTVARWNQWAGRPGVAADILRKDGYDRRQVQQFLWWNQDYAPFGGAPLGQELPKTAPTSPEDVFRPPAPRFTVAKVSAVAGITVALAVATWAAFRG